ncbi:MAG: hypothetical protein HY866_07000 [Chloroflexi bacterium]|nr:hypothetical protein [Chloroflexota bacterium]
MLTPMTPETKRPRFRTEREYREWQLSLRGNMPVKRLYNEPGFLARLMSTIRCMIARRLHRAAEPRRIEQECVRLRS